MTRPRSRWCSGLLASVAGWALALGCASTGPATYRVQASCRDGRPDGAYVAEGPGGDRIEGRYCEGVRCGVFTFYSGPGIKVAALTYRSTLLHGIARVWYLPHTAPDSPHRRKFEGVFARGQLHGDAWTWWPTGRPRSAFAYRQGAVSGGTAWGPDGAELDAAEAFAMATRDSDTDRYLFRALGAIITANPPVCGPA